MSTLKNKERLLKKSIDTYWLTDVKTKNSGLKMRIWVGSGEDQVTAMSYYGDKFISDKHFYVSLDGVVSGDVGKLAVEDVDELIEFVRLNRAVLEIIRDNETETTSVLCEQLINPMGGK